MKSMTVAYSVHSEEAKWTALRLSSGCELDEKEKRKVSEPGNTCEKCGDVFHTEAEVGYHVKEYHEGSERCMFCTFRGNKMDD